MPYYLWGTERRKGDLNEIAGFLASAGVDCEQRVFPDSAASEWEDELLLITGLGSFAGKVAIRRAVPFLLASKEDDELIRSRG